MRKSFADSPLAVQRFADWLRQMKQPQCVRNGHPALADALPKLFLRQSMLVKELTARSDSAALKRVVWPMIHVVM